MNSAALFIQNINPGKNVSRKKVHMQRNSMTYFWEFVMNLIAHWNSLHVCPVHFFSFAISNKPCQRINSKLCSFPATYVLFVSSFNAAVFFTTLDSLYK